LLEGAIFVMQVVCRVLAVLLFSGKTIFASPADPRQESYAHDLTYRDIGFAAWTEGDNASYTLMASDMRELDLGDGLSIWSSCCAISCMKVCKNNIHLS
jgi:hypothetical protein